MRSGWKAEPLQISRFQSSIESFPSFRSRVAGLPFVPRIFGPETDIFRKQLMMHFRVRISSQEENEGVLGLASVLKVLGGSALVGQQTFFLHVFQGLPRLT